MKLDLDVLPIKYWSTKTIMSYIQRRIIVYSIMYYELSESCITDKDFDELSHQLVELMKATPKEICKESQYWYAMYDFDGSTGFDIPDRLTDSDRDYLTKIAQHVLKNWRCKNKNGNQFKRD